MSNASWQTKFRQILDRPGRNGLPARIAILGVGHELRGDDAVGVLLARALRESQPAWERIKVLETGPVPENFGGALRRLDPDVVLILDAAQMGERPGVARWLDWEEVDWSGISTHSTSLRLFAGYLTDELGCEIVLLGIEPANMAFDAPVSAPVRKSIEKISASILKLLAGESERFPVNTLPLKSSMIRDEATGRGLKME